MAEEEGGSNATQGKLETLEAGEGPNAPLLDQDGGEP